MYLSGTLMRRIIRPGGSYCIKFIREVITSSDLHVMEIALSETAAG